VTTAVGSRLPGSRDRAAFLPLACLMHDVFIKRRAALKASEGHYLGNGVLAGGVELSGPLQLAGAQCLDSGPSASSSASGAGGFQSGLGALADDVALKLGQGGHQMKHQFAGGGGGINVLFEAAHLNAALSQGIDSCSAGSVCWEGGRPGRAFSKRSFPELPSASPAAPEPAGRSRLACRCFATEKDEVPYNDA